MSFASLLESVLRFRVVPSAFHPQAAGGILQTQQRGGFVARSLPVAPLDIVILRRSRKPSWIGRREISVSVVEKQRDPLMLPGCADQKVGRVVAIHVSG